MQLGTARFVGTFLSPDPLDVPWTVVEYLAGQLGIADPSVVRMAATGEYTVADLAEVFTVSRAPSTAPSSDPRQQARPG